MQLSIYVGLKAIAWLVTQESEIVANGIKKVNIDFDSYYEFVAGLPISKRVKRRMKRQARRNLQRFKTRRERLKQYLYKRFKCYPQHLTRQENLQLRVKALSQTLTNQEMVNVLTQLQRKRGYKSLRGISENQDSEYLQTMQAHEQNAQQHLSIAAYLLSLPTSKNIVFTRQSHEQEFHKIMDAQQIDLQTRQIIYRIIYFQRPLKKPPVAKCNYEPNRYVCHASNPLYQEFRILRDVMNICIYDSNNDPVEIPLNQRKKWFAKCFNGKNLNKASCLKDLGIKKPSEYQWFSGKSIAANPVWKAFDTIKVYEAYCHVHTHFNLDKQTLYYQLWQDIHSATSDDKLASLLKRKYRFNDNLISELIDIDFSDIGWAEYSTKAIRKLIPHMQNGKTLKEAILEVYQQVALKEAYPRNLVIEQHFESFKSIIKHLKKIYPINSCNFEIDHLLKQSNKSRKEIAQNKRKDEKLAKQYPHLSSYDLVKLKLWEESGGISPYQPDTIIDKSELFTDAYNLDHIVPKSLLFERSINNQVLCPTELNAQKGRMTGITFAKHLNIEQAYIEAVNKFPEHKQKFLLMSEEQIPNGYISQTQNRDYYTRCFYTIASQIFPQATNIPNKLINFYQRQWELNLFNEQDARHFLCKAWVAANMSQQTITYFDNIKDHSSNQASISAYNIQPHLPYIDFHSPIMFIPRIKYVRRTPYGYTPRFALHKESIYGTFTKQIRNAKGEIVNKTYYSLRQPIHKLTPHMVERIIDKLIQRKVKERLKQYGSHDEAINSLIDNPLIHNHQPIKRVKIAVNSASVFAIHSTNEKGITASLQTYDKKTDYVFSEKNYCLKLTFDKQGKVHKQVITLHQFVNYLNQKQPLDLDGFIIKENDIVELHGKHWYVLGATEGIALRSVYNLSATEKYNIKSDEWKHLVKIKVNQVSQIVSTHGIKDCNPTKIDKIH